jgi:hypothetical protein
LFDDDEELTVALVEEPGAKQATEADGSDDTGFLSSAPARKAPESALVRVVATAGIVGIATAIGAGLGAADVETWLVALVVALVSVVLAAILWRSRVL